MRGGLGILTLILALAALKAALVVIVASLGLALVVSFIARPRETIVLTTTVGLFSLAHAYPVPVAATAGIIWLGWAVTKTAARSNPRFGGRHRRAELPANPQTLREGY